MPGAPDLIVDDAPRLPYQKDSPDLRHSFLETSRAHGVAAEWRERDADSASVARIVVAAARGADLVVPAQEHTLGRIQRILTWMMR
jgi:hypothetical protein